MNTPIFDFVNEYKNKDVLRAHMPGHKGRRGLGAEPLDITEIDGAGDLYRAYNYSPLDDPNNAEKFFIKDSARQAFGFKFPDGTFLRANSNVHAGNVPTILDKLESLAGRVHPRQQSALLFAVSQAGISLLKGGLAPYGIHSSEHACVDFTISKDDKTGAITVKYSGPEDLPVRFSWTTTIYVDGTSTTTPMVVEKPIDNLAPPAAKKMVAASAKRMGVKLDKEDTVTAATLLSTHAKGMMAKNARVLANFIVNTLAKVDEIDENMLANVAGDIKGWQEFDFGDVHLLDMGRKFVERQNNYLKDKLGKPDEFLESNPDVFESFYKDANRSSWRIGGKNFPLGTKPGVILGAFLNAVKNANARKAISTLLNQGNLADLQCLNYKAPAAIGGKKADDEEELLHTIKGGEMFVSRNYARDDAVITTSADLHYELDVSADGKTAVVTVTQDMHLCTAAMHGDPNYRIGKASVSQKSTIDLTKDPPVVTGVVFSQTFTPDEIQLGQA